VFGALQSTGGVQQQFPTTNVRTGDETFPVGRAARVEVLLYDGIRPGFILSLPDDSTSTPDHRQFISDGMRPGFLP
jgi:hypothetical protein